jgi:organic radical activating enzyme
MAIKVGEIFESLQGEGMYQGVPSIFLRVFGCNKKCEGFSMPRGEKSVERFTILPEQLTKYEDAPLVSTGCDSYMSWDPRFKDFSPEQTISQIADRIQLLLHNGKFNQDCHLILTGGEPLLAWQKQYPELLDEFVKRDMGLTHLTFETNGTMEITSELRMALCRHFNNSKLETTFSVSAKLPCSGETWESSIKPKVVIGYTMIPGSRTYLKFVVGTEEDFDDAKLAVKEYRDAGFTGSVYVMPVGGTTETYNLTNKRVAELAITNGYRYSPRLQVELWKNVWGS